MKSKTKPKSRKPTQSTLASLLGVSRQLIAAHIKKDGAPALDDLSGWTVFLAQRGRIGSAPDDLRRAIAQERLDILKETRIKLARENQIAAGETMLVADAEHQAGQAMGYAFEQLGRMDRELPPALAGGTAVEIGKILAANTERIRATLTEKFKDIGKE